jgi:hypothetical protein
VEKIDNSFSSFFYNPLVFGNGKRFCVALQEQLLESEIDDKVNFFSESLGSIFFNSSYFTLNGHPLIIVLNSRKGDQPGSSENNSLDLLRGIFKYLGYDHFYYCVINTLNQEIVGTNIDLDLRMYIGEADADHSARKWYLNFLGESKVSQKLIFFFPSHLNSLTDTCSELNNAEKEFHESNPQVFTLLEEQRNFGKRFEQCEINIQGLRKDLESRDEYIANLHVPETTLKRLSDFYHNEYEILPLWYKRFGHLIKVLMGKRSFRSLFDDKVKKYKD